MAKTARAKLLKTQFLLALTVQSQRAYERHVTAERGELLPELLQFCKRTEGHDRKEIFTFDLSAAFAMLKDTILPYALIAAVLLRV